MTMLLNKLKVPTAQRLLLGTLLYAAGYFSMGFCTGPWFMAAAVLVLTLGELTVFPAFFSATAKVAPPDKMGMTMAARSLADGVGMAVGPWLGALAYAHWTNSPVLLWTILALPALVAGLGFLRMGKSINQS